MNYKAWDEYRGKIKTKKGGWRIGKGVTSHGYDLLNEIVGNYSYMQLVILNATGRMPSKELADWLEAAYICLSWPDPRIWCNRIGALGGTISSSLISTVCAGVMANDSKIYGARTILDGMTLIQSAKKNIDKGISVEEFVNTKVKENGGKPLLMGYARPIATGDERVNALVSVAKKLGFGIDEHLSIGFEIEKVLHRRYGETMNVNGCISGFMADQGFTPKEALGILSTLVASGIVACYVDTQCRPSGSFSPLQASDIVYSGHTPRAL